MSAVLDRPTTDLDSDSVGWDDLTPPCEATLCDPNAPAELICKHRHFAETNCHAEGHVYLVCGPCYEQIKEHTAICLKCKTPANVVAVERLK